MPEPARPYRVEADGGSLVVRCEVLTVALREGEKMVRMTQADVHVYHREQFLQTIRAQRPT